MANTPKTDIKLIESQSTEPALSGQGKGIFEHYSSFVIFEEKNELANKFYKLADHLEQEGIALRPNDIHKFLNTNTNEQNNFLSKTDNFLKSLSDNDKKGLSKIFDNIYQFSAKLEKINNNAQTRLA